MANTIKLKRGTSTPSTSDISSGEVAIDTSAQKLYINDSGTVKEIGGSGSSIGGNTGVDFNDNVQARWGTGNDLEIFHNGTDSLIQSHVTGNIEMRARQSLIVKTNATSGGADDAIKVLQNGAVELFYDHSKKFETTSAGITVTGTFTDGGLTYNNADTLSIDHSSTDENSYIKIAADDNRRKTLVFDSGGTTRGVIGIGDSDEASATSLFLSANSNLAGNSPHITIDSSGNLNIPNDSGKLQLGTSQDLQIYHDGTHSRIVDNGANATSFQTGELRIHDLAANEYLAKFVANGAVDLYYDNVKKLETTSAGVAITGNAVATSKFRGNDDVKLSLGDAEDLQLYHNGTHSYITNQTGNFHIESNTCVLRSASQETYFLASVNGASKLYYDDALKFETTSTGTKITGKSEIDGDVQWNGSDGSWGAYWDQSANIVSFKDDKKIALGTDNDLQIYHNATDSVIKSDTNKLRILSDEVLISNNADGEPLAKFNANGNVELYYDDSKKLETNSNGIQVQGRVQVSDSIETFTNDTNLKLNSAGSSGQIKFHINGSEKAKFDSSGNFSINNDSGKITLGTGSDLQIYHSGSDSIIECINDHPLWLQSDGAIRLVKDAAAEYYATFNPDGACELYYDNTKKFETISAGCRVASGNLYILDNSEINIGNGNDLQIYHNGSASYLDNDTGHFYIRNGGGNTIHLQPLDGEDAIQAYGNDRVELLFDHSKKLETRSDGVEVTGHLYLGSDNNTIILGNDSDMQLWHSGTHGYIYNKTGWGILRSDNWQIADKEGVDVMANFKHDGACELYYDNSKKLSTDAHGVQIHDWRLQLNAAGEGEAAEMYFYADQGDDDGDTWRLTATNGDSSSGSFYLQGYPSGSLETFLRAGNNGPIELFYDNSKKLETAASGVTVVANSDIRFTTGTWTGDACKIQNHSNYLYIQGGSNGIRFRRNNGTDSWYIDSNGNFFPAINNQYSIGTSSNRVANLYVNDLQLSNFAKKDTGGNDVDGTWGDWTLQEGDENIFMINNRSGKKYKMALQEVN